MTTATTQNLDRLKKSAMKSAMANRHQMAAFQGLHEQPLIAESICEKCEAYIQVNAEPTARLAIGGTAIIYECGDN